MSVLRVGVCKLLTSKPLLSVKDVTAAQCSFISSKQIRETRECVKKPAPWPYQEKHYKLWHGFFDRTTHRFDDNSKIIIVEGPTAAGKAKFAEALAANLEMLYMPPVNMDRLYINPYGYDMRQLDPQLPPDCRSFDINNFHKCPTHKETAAFQIRMYKERYSQYVDALAHVLSTGQGVVLHRSPYSDFVFLEAMVKQGYISKPAKSVYYEVKTNTISELMKPHLVIYLDISPDTVLERIKARGDPVEIDSKVYSCDYLETINTLYKQDYLKQISTHAELLVYDWTTPGDLELVTDDIERIDFERFEKHDPKMKDWRFAKEWDWAEVRMLYASEKSTLMNYFNVPRLDVPELLVDAHDTHKLHEVWFNAPGMKYRVGYNSDMGDTGIFTKRKLEERNTL